MLAKWIVVDTSNRAAFDEAQKRWSDLLEYDGFIVQAGGWVDTFPAKAGILAIWRNFGAYRQFMDAGHAELALQQKEISERIDVTIAGVIMQINQPDPRLLVGSAECLRVSDVTLQPNSSPIFVARQLQIWNPALRSADGMLGALVCRVDGNRDRFLAASFWRDRAALENFQATVFPATSKQASTETYMKSLISYHFALESAWRVVKPALTGNPQTKPAV
jgi:heme-degrading monooxygenase HmoA